MPVKRRTRKTMKRKPSYRRKRAAMKMARQVHFFKRHAQISTITASVSSAGSVTNIAGGYVVALSQLPNYTELTTMYDQYKILGAKLTFVPGATEQISDVVTGSTSAYSLNRFVSAIDFDDNTTPASENQLLEYGSCKWTRGGRVHKRYWKPKMLHEIYNGVSTAYAPAKSQWISTSYPAVPHYGLKIWCAAPNVPFGTATSVTYNVHMVLYFACKNTK